ncbi:hypothetical protein [Carnobacterium sp.]|uniref:hypothetical protein n=1 Tax=Carnobacterium sp. TaxID=48221 RepID=UPI00388FE3C8
MKKIVTKTILMALSLSIVGTSFPSLHVFASEKIPTVVYNENGVKTEQSENEIILEDSITNETLVLEYTNDDQTGHVDTLLKDSDGNLLINGEVVIELISDTDSTSSMNPAGTSSIAATTSWTLFNTKKYKQSVLKSANTTAIALAYLYPPIGTVAGIVSAIQSVFNTGKPAQKELYVLIKQYHNNKATSPSLYQIKTTSSIYRKSNYTSRDYY